MDWGKISLVFDCLLQKLSLLFIWLIDTTLYEYIYIYILDQKISIEARMINYFNCTFLSQV